MNNVPQDIPFKVSSLSSITSIIVALLTGMYIIAVRPVESGVAGNHTDIRANASVIRSVELSNARVMVLVTQQNSVLLKLSKAIDRLSEKATFTNRGS